MKVSEFAIKHNISTNSLYVAKSSGTLPSTIFTKPKNSGVDDVDESYFLRRWAFIRKVKYANQDLFYLLNEYFNMTTISEEVTRLFGGHTHSMNAYISSVLFTIEPEVNTLRVSKNAWRLYRYWWTIEKRLRRRGTSIEKILDKRMNDAEEVA